MRRWRLSHVLLFVGSLYLLILSFQFHKFLEIAVQISGDDTFTGLDTPAISMEPMHHNTLHHRILENTLSLGTHRNHSSTVHLLPVRPVWHHNKNTQNESLNLTELEKMAEEAWILGQKAWLEIGNFELNGSNFHDQLSNLGRQNDPSCPSGVSVTGTEIGTDRMVFLSCGLSAGSAITLVGTPRVAHEEFVHGTGTDTVMVSQFAVELQGLRAVDGEDAPKILHLNPRVRGDWNKRPVIEHNTCYRMQWGDALRCDGSPSQDEDDRGTNATNGTWFVLYGNFSVVLVTLVLVLDFGLVILVDFCLCIHQSVPDLHYGAATNHTYHSDTVYICLFLAHTICQFTTITIN